MGFYVQPDYEDIVDETYFNAFDSQIIKAREIIREENPDYQYKFG